MDSQSSSKRTLPNNPRVSDKIMEYYAKYGQGRDLEKFMRLYSPASSQESQNTQSGISCGTNKGTICTHTKSQETICSDCGCTCTSIRPLSRCCKKGSKSLPNVGVHGQNDGEAYFPAKDVISDINIEEEENKKKIISISTESLQTPKNFNNNKTQTPDSVAKSHRRLEWDSLGDIGYQKSMSTSNISVLEKSLLKEFFKEDSVALEPATSTQAKSERIEQQQIYGKQPKADEIEHNTPPLASSTLVHSNNRGAKPKQLTKSTSSTSLQEKFEKFVQTTLRNLPTVSSKEVQCSMSCSSNSMFEGTVTPSSFDYVSSRSSRSHSSKSPNVISHTTDNIPQQQNNICEHPFITSITELLIKRKVLAEKNQQTQTQTHSNSIQQLKTNLKSAFDENKENQTHSSISVCSSTSSSISLSKKAPELDLGIQLICSLIDAKSVNGKQKKRLIRDIVKRLSRLEINENLSQSSTDNSSAVLYDSIRSSINNKQEHFKMTKEKIKTKSNVISIPIIKEQIDVKESTTSTTNTTESSTDSNVPKAPIEGTNKLKFDNDTAHLHRMRREEGHSNKHLASREKKQKHENNTNVPRLTARQIEQIKTVQKKETTSQRSKMTNETKTKRSTLTKTVLKSQQVTPIPSTTSSASSSRDLTTQKFIGPVKSDLNNSNTDAEQTSMGEWLNPLTQSEIEYEEKKRDEIRKKEATTQKQKLVKKIKHDCGRMQQLNWIENEIRRLECLKHLLLKDVTTTTTEQNSCNLSKIVLTSPSDKTSDKDSTRTYKLYDTVYSDKSSVLSENEERLVHEIEIILEESHEDVVNLKDNLKKSKNRTKETQILFERPNSSDTNDIERKVKPTFRSVKETININEEQVLNDQASDTENKQKSQREKIDTPSTEESQNSESLKDMVQQRKKEFIEAYKTKKQHHYEALKQQQKEHFKYLNIQRKIKERSKTTTTSTTTDTDHYSVPLTETRKCNANDLSYAYTQNHPLPLTPLESENLKTKNLKTIYSTTANPPPPNKTTFGKQFTINNAITATTSSSSTSIFCISSDVSVPMGSGNTSSTPTTTHQYDDVAVAAAAAAVMPGIAIQTSDSIMCTKPIYDSKQTASFFTPYNIAPATTITTSNSTTACIQVKPKGIAYVIEFENDKKNSNSNSSLNRDINRKSKTKTSTSSHTDDTNDVKASSSANEPQLTLQEHLEKRKPLFLQHSKERKAILNQLQRMRQERDRQLREIINNSSFNSLDKRLKYLPPPPIQKVRILKTKEMKALTNKRFSNLPEVVAKQEHETELKKRKSNRILRDVFNRRLQKRVRSGKLSLNHSKTVI